MQCNSMQINQSEVGDAVSGGIFTRVQPSQSTIRRSSWVGKVELKRRPLAAKLHCSWGLQSKGWKMRPPRGHYYLALTKTLIGKISLKKRFSFWYCPPGRGTGQSQPMSESFGPFSSSQVSKIDIFWLRSHVLGMFFFSITRCSRRTNFPSRIQSVRPVHFK